MHNPVSIIPATLQVDILEKRKTDTTGADLEKWDYHYKLSKCFTKKALFIFDPRVDKSKYSTFLENTLKCVAAKVPLFIESL